MDIHTHTTPTKAYWPPLHIRYDSVALPEDIALWQQACRFEPHRAEGAAAYHKLCLSTDTVYLERLAWAAMSLYQEALKDELNAVALQAQKWLSGSAQDPDIQAYARFMGSMLSEREAGHNQNSAAVDPSLPDWMADDWQILGMVQARAEEERLRRFNALLASKGLTTVEAFNADGRNSPLLDRLTSQRDAARNGPADPAKLVSVILPVYNAESTVEASVRSLLSQTWPHIEVIAVDDASTDASAAVLQEMARLDSRLRIVRSDRNRGAYPARNLGLSQAQGQYVTVADSDDWHHPEKIEQQVTCLMANPHLIATMSAGLRATEDLTPVARARPYYKQANLSSLMFPRLKIMETLGAWNAVRFGADTEFFNRLAMVYGADSLLTIDLPLFIGRVRADSLTNDPLHGYVGHDLGARKEYVECYRFFQRHASGSALTYPLAPDTSLPFPVPRLSVNPSGVRIQCDTVYAADLRDEHHASRAIYHHQQTITKGLRLELLHVPTFNPAVHDGVVPFLRDYLVKHGQTVATAGETITTETLMFHTSISKKQIRSQYPDVHYQMTQPDLTASSFINEQALDMHQSPISPSQYNVQELLELRKELPQEFQIEGLEHLLKYENIRQSPLCKELFKADVIDTKAIDQCALKVAAVDEFEPFLRIRTEESNARWQRLLKYANERVSENRRNVQLSKLLSNELRSCDDYRINILLANTTTEEQEWLTYFNKYLEKIGAPNLSLKEEKKDSVVFRITTNSAASRETKGAPLVSVIMPCFNAEKHLEWAAKSILQQTWNNLELIIVDDCSTDETPSQLKTLAASDARVKLIRTPFNAGPYVAKNLGIAIAEGEIITGHDADDWAMPDRIELQLQNQIGLGQPVSVGQMIRLSANGTICKIGMPSGFSPDGILRKASVSAMFRTDFFRTRLGSWDNVRYAADSEMLARAAIALGHPVTFSKVLTMLCLDLESSLTNHVDSSIGDGNLTGTRLVYKESWQAWHRQLASDRTYLPLDQGRRYFDAPLSMQNQ